jgi:hypothetical protein
MQRPRKWPLIIAGLLFGLTTVLFLTLGTRVNIPEPDAIKSTAASSLLTDPFLQYPTTDAVRVVWFTEFEGTSHAVSYGELGQETSLQATTTRLTRTREDQKSQVPGQPYDSPSPRPIWRHEVTVSGLVPGQRYPYQVFSMQAGGALFKSRRFTLAAAPPVGQPLKILLTSDHQLMPMTAANLQKVQETVGLVDGVFLAGDLVNIPDRASEWFDDVRGRAFFPCLQGRAHAALEYEGQKTTYVGGEIIQHAPLFPAVGNHEVMGRYSEVSGLNDQFNDPIPWAAARQLYTQYPTVFNPDDRPEVARQWLKNNSFNIDTYEEIFSLPTLKRPDGGETKRYYAITFGDIRLISLYVTQIWRAPDLEPKTRGRYRERQADLNNPMNWGYGQHIFEGIHRGSPQYEWLQQELQSEAFHQAKYKIVMLHHPPHTLGGNIVPAFTNPVRVSDRNLDGSLKAIRYEYPKDQDYIMRDLVPLLESAGVQLVFYGHSHVWNRFTSPSGLHFLETSNVGNTYGAHDASNPRPVPQVLAQNSSEFADHPFTEDYGAVGNPNGLKPVMPTLAPLQDAQGQPMPYIASNEITVFSILETGTGTISSYYFDTRQPDSEVVKFDVFAIQ